MEHIAISNKDKSHVALLKNAKLNNAEIPTFVQR